MEQKLAFKISIIGLILLLLGVSIYLWRKPVTCPEIEEQALRSLDFHKTDVDEMLHWLETTHQALIRPVQKYETIAEETELKWQGSSGIYYARFYENSLVDVHIHWDTFWGIGPTGKEVVECLGQPDLYYADYALAPHSYGLSVDLWYLQKGMVVRSIHFDEEWQATPVIDENVVMTNLHLLVPGSAEEINRRKTLKGSHTNYPISVLKPWPGSWKEVVVDNLSNY